VTLKAKLMPDTERYQANEIAAITQKSTVHQTFI